MPVLDADVAWPDDAVEVGRIVDAWGVKGWFKIQPYSADPQALFSSRRWFVRPAPAEGVVRPGAETAAMAGCLRIAGVREHGGAVVAKADGFDDRSAAESLRGAPVFVARSSFPTAGKDEFYWVDLIGLQVLNRQGELLGTVVGLIDTGPQSVLRVQPAAEDGAAVSAEAQRLIPFVAAYVDEVDQKNQRILVDWGLDF